MFLCTSFEKVIKLSYRQGKNVHVHDIFFLCVGFFYSLSFVFVLFQTLHMSAFLSVTWTITSRRSRKHLMRLTWTRTQMLDLLYSPSVPTTVMKVGRIKKCRFLWSSKAGALRYKFYLLRSAEESLFSVPQKLLFISLYCLTQLYFDKRRGSILWT